jgi:SNW domain-containing protein 1
MQQPKFVRYTPSEKAPGKNPEINQRIVRIVEQQVDPLAPGKFRNRKVPAGPGSPPAPILRSPPRKLTKEDQANWKIPPCISNWKNAKGYVVPLDKRIGADGRTFQEVTVNSRFASLAEDLYDAEKSARDEIKIRNDLARQQKAKIEEAREQELRELAQQARARRGTTKSEEDSVHERARQELMRETLREHRMAKAGKNAARDRDEGRDISEMVALGKQVQPTMKGEAIYDSRLFNQEGGGLSSGFQGEDSNGAYDTKLFADRTSAAGYKYDEKRMNASREELDDMDKRRPMLGKDIAGPSCSSLEFVTEGTEEEDDPFNIRDLLTKKQKF